MTIRLHRGADAEISTGLLLPKVVRALFSELRVGLRKCTNLVKFDWTSTSSVDEHNIVGIDKQPHSRTEVSLSVPGRQRSSGRRDRGELSDFA